MEEITIEEVYGICKREVELTRHITKSGKVLETFESPVQGEVCTSDVDTELGEETVTWTDNKYTVELSFPEFTCKCPRTSHPDFANITIKYTPDKRCVEMKSLKYYYNSFRDEGHFHEQVCNLIYDDLKEILDPIRLVVTGSFNPRGGTYPVITVGEGSLK